MSTLLAHSQRPGIQCPGVWRLLIIASGDRGAEKGKKWRRKEMLNEEKRNRSICALSTHPRLFLCHPSLASPLTPNLPSFHFPLLSLSSHPQAPCQRHLILSRVVSLYRSVSQFPASFYLFHHSIPYHTISCTGSSPPPTTHLYWMPPTLACLTPCFSNLYVTSRRQTSKV